MRGGDDGTPLYGDPDLRVLWLGRGRHELALSADGIWIHAGRHRADLTWDDVDQVQLDPVGRRGTHARVEVFRRDGAPHAVGPFPAPKAERWVRACERAAAESGRPTRRLAGAVGFALPPSGGLARQPDLGSPGPPGWAQGSDVD